MLRVRLVLASGKKRGRRVAVKAGRFYVGRHRTCDLRLKSDLISRWHCVFLQDEEQVVVTDLGSQNGTFVNGHKLSEGDSCRLQHHDTLLIGKAEFRLSVRDAESGKGLVFRDSDSQIKLVTLDAEPETRVHEIPLEEAPEQEPQREPGADELLKELDDIVGPPEGREAGESAIDHDVDVLAGDDADHVLSEPETHSGDGALSIGDSMVGVNDASLTRLAPDPSDSDIIGGEEDSDFVGADEMGQNDDRE